MSDSSNCANNCGKPSQHGLKFTDRTGYSVTFAVCRSCAVSLKRSFQNWIERDGITLGLAKVDEANA